MESNERRSSGAFLFHLELILKRLTHERAKRQMTQRDVAKRIGLSYNSLFKIEQGRLIPGSLSDTARKLERFFGYRLRTLLADI